MNKKIFILILFVFSLVNVSAQEPIEVYRHNTWIMGVPQHLFQNGIRIEIDKRLNGPGRWIVFAPSVYYKEKRGNWLFGDYDVHSIKGAGLDLMYRWYPNEIANIGGIYLSAGGGYRFIEREFRGNQWDSYEENGLTYYDYNVDSWYKETQTINLKGIAGFQLVLDNHMAVDFFMGAGLKYSITDIPGNIVEYHYDDVYTLGGTGFYFVGGVRVGIGW